MTATYDLRINWNADGDFTDALEDVTGRALARTRITFEYGRDTARPLAPVAAGSGGFELDNEDRYLSPENPSSPLAAFLLPGRPFRAKATVAGTTYALFRGHTSDAPLQPDVEARSVSFGVLDGLAKLRGQKISTPLHQGLRTGAALGLVLDAVGWTAGRDVDLGATVISWWWEEQTDALTAVERIVNSEGPPALVTVGPDGEFVFRDRHHRLLRAASTTVQATWRGDGAEPVMAKGFVYDNGWSGIVNDVTFAVDVRQPSGALTPVWTSEATVSVADGETVEINAQASDPFLGAVVPVAGVDYTLHSGAVTITLSRTSGQAVTILVKATGGPAVLSGLQLRAYPVPVAYTTQVHEEDSASIGTDANPKYGRRSWPTDAPWAGVHDARAIAQIILAHRAERLPLVTVRFVGGNDTRLGHMLARDLSDRVRIVEPELGIDADFYVERISHSFNGDPGHETRFVCEKAATIPANVFRFDTAGAGFNDGMFGTQGLDDPANIFLFDGAGRGFDQGILAH